MRAWLTSFILLSFLVPTSPAPAVETPVARNGTRAIACQLWHQNVLQRLRHQERVGLVWEELSEDLHDIVMGLERVCADPHDGQALARYVAVMDLLKAFER